MTCVIISMTCVMFIYFSALNRSNGESVLILPCEVAVRCVVPAAKALVAKALMEERGLSQDQVADILGISQSAVSKYSRKVRGNAIDIDGLEEIRPFINGMVSVLLDSPRQSPKLLQFFCRACVAIRKTSLICVFCEKSGAQLKIAERIFCFNLSSEENEELV